MVYYVLCWCEQTQTWRIFSSGRFYWFLRFQSTRTGALLFVQGQILLIWLDVPTKELTDINNLTKRTKQCWIFLYKCCVVSIKNVNT